MKRCHGLTGSVFLLAVGALASGCVVRARPAPVVVSGGVYVDGSSDYATVYPTTFAPEPIPEYRPAAPGYGYTWVDGYWDWTGYDWTWSTGYWVPERVGYAYIAPRYVYVDGRPVYYRGYWQGNNGYREYGYGGYRGAPPAAWRGTPQTQPTVWRSQPVHTQWRGTATTAAPPPAGGWRGGATTPAPAPSGGFRGTPTTSTAPPPALRRRTAPSRRNSLSTSAVADRQATWRLPLLAERYPRPCRAVVPALARPHGQAPDK